MYAVQYSTVNSKLHIKILVVVQYESNFIFIGKESESERVRKREGEQKVLLRRTRTSDRNGMFANSGDGRR